MLNIWLMLTFALALLNWAALRYGWAKVNYLTKPTVMLALLAWFTYQGGWQNGLWFFGLALIFSLIGDVLLLLPPRFFILGLTAFLLVHISYILGLRPTSPVPELPTLIIAMMVLSVGSVLFGALRRALKKREDYKRLIAPLVVYGIVLSLMFFSSLLTMVRADWRAEAAGLTAAGGILFFTSDNLLGYDRFVQPLPNARLWVRITYHLGQVALISGVLLNSLLG